MAPQNPIYVPQVTEVLGKSYITQAALLLLNTTDSTAVLDSTDARSPLSLRMNSLLPILRDPGQPPIGYAHAQEGQQGVIFKIFLDFSIPERLDLENGEKRFLEMHGENGIVTHLEFTAKNPSWEGMLAIGDPEGSLY